MGKLASRAVRPDGLHGVVHLRGPQDALLHSKNSAFEEFSADQELGTFEQFTGYCWSATAPVDRAGGMR